MECKRCGKSNIVKNGSRRGKPCFLCKDCGHQFISVVYIKISEQERDYEKCAAILLIKKITLTQTAKLLARKLTTVDYWVGHGKNSLPRIDKKKFIKYLAERENGADILYLLGKPDAKPSENLLRLLAPAPRRKKSITKKEIENQQRIERENQRAQAIEKQKTLASSTPIIDRKNAIEKLWILLGCSQRLLLSLRYSDLDCKSVGENFTFKCFVEFIDRNYNIKILEAVSLFDRNKCSGYVLTEKIKEIVLWLKKDSEKNRQSLGTEYENTYNDFFCVKSNGKFFYPHELKKNMGLVPMVFLY